MTKTTKKIRNVVIIFLIILFGIASIFLFGSKESIFDSCYTGKYNLNSIELISSSPDFYTYRISASPTCTVPASNPIMMGGISGATKTNFGSDILLELPQSLQNDIKTNTQFNAKSITLNGLQLIRARNTKSVFSVPITSRNSNISGGCELRSEQSIFTCINNGTSGCGTTNIKNLLACNAGGSVSTDPELIAYYGLAGLNEIILEVDFYKKGEIVKSPETVLITTPDQTYTQISTPLTPTPPTQPTPPPQIVQDEVIQTPVSQDEPTQQKTNIKIIVTILLSIIILILFILLIKKLVKK